jgi:2'-5' RNA ligase
MRLFIAINFPNEIKKQITDIIEILREDSIQGRFVGEEHMHLTVEFLGEINEEEFKEIRGVLEKTSFEPFTLRPNRIGYFRRREGNIFWLGLEANQSLFKLQAELHKELKSKGIKLEDREYRPHITLGRQVKLKNNSDVHVLNRRLKELIESIEINCDRIDLMKSERIRGRLVHSRIMSSLV